MKKLLTLCFANCRRGLLAIGLFLTGSFVFAQVDVTGTLTDASSGDPIIGASIFIKGTTSGTITGIDGGFTITAAPSDVLVFSYLGYVTEEIQVGDQTEMNVALSVDVQQLQEIIVTGYATQQKKDLTGSVGVVQTDDLVSIPTGQITGQLQGRVAGVTVTQDARPGENARVRIRGFGSFQSNDPLYVVDGVPTQDISYLSPDDVASLTVLKDAGAASIYGSRASNGVIVITTKGGSSGRVRVNYNMYVGSQDPGDGPENLLNTQEFADLQWLVYQNDGTNEVHPIYGPSPAAGGSSPQLPSWAADTRWYDALTRNALIMNHNLSLSGGNDNSKFFGALNYLQHDGIVIHNFRRRYSVRFNSEFNIKDRVTVGENFSVASRSGNNVQRNGQEGAFLGPVYRSQPIIPVIMTQAVDGLSHNFQPGDWGGTGIAPRLGNVGNEVADRERNKLDRNNDVSLIGSFYADLKIMEGLNVRSTFGGTIQNGYNTNWFSATYESSENALTPNYNENSYYNHQWVWTNTVTFNRAFGLHNLLAVAGYEAVKFGIGRNLSATRAAYFSDAFAFRSVSNGANITAANSGYNTPTTLVSNFLRADYAFDDKYLVSATIRRDGSSRFGEGEKYGFFPSVTAAWRVSREAFMSGSSVISSLKLRGGYGTMGNQLAIDPANQFFLFGGSADATNYDLNGTGSSSLQGFRPTRIGNPNAKWETNITTNIGFDAGLFDNKIELIFDWYTKKTEDLLYNPELPGTAGAAAVPFINTAEMRNRGVDLQVIYRNNFASGLDFEANLTFTSYNNEILKITEGIDFFDSGDGTRIGVFNRNEVGRSLGEFYGYQVMGLFQSDAEASGAPTQDGAEAGFFRYGDLDGNNLIDPEDRTYIGDPNPDFTYGLNLSFGYKNFDLTTFFYGSKGNDIFNYNKWWVDFWPSFQGQKSTDLLYNSWTPSNTNATVPKASNKSNFSNNTQSVSYYIEDGSFLRMKNIQLGYTFPQSFLANIGLTDARIYLQGVNLFTITDYTGLDPELSVFGDLNPGVDEFNNPTVKQYLVGLSVGF